MKKLNFVGIIFLVLFYATSLDASKTAPNLLQNRLETLKSSLSNLKIKLTTLQDKLAELKDSLISTEEKQYLEPEPKALDPEQKKMVTKALAQEWKAAGLKSEDIPTAVGLINFYKNLMYNGNDVFVAQNLESYLASNADPKNFADYLTGAINLDDESLKNDIRKEISKRWIRNAAVRVFNDPLRSFLEIIVNACDATLPQEESVGKFGMGFLSILQLLAFEETGGVKIEIITTYQRSETEGDNALYRMIFDLDTKETDFSKIDFKNVGIKINFKYVIGPATKETGTVVLLKPRKPGKKFSQKTVDSLKKYTHYLDFYDKIQIDLNGQIINEKYAHTSKPVVKVIVDEDGLAVMDNGRGISLYVALLKLLIPSSSTKVSKGLLQARESMRNAKVTDTTVEPVAFVDFKGKKDQKSHFLITVNGVVAIDVPMKHDVKIGGEIKDLLIKLPQAAQLTLARDELVMAHSTEHESDPDPEKRGKGAEEVFLNRIIDKTINGCLNGTIETSMLQYLCYALKDWENQTSNLYIKDRFSSYLCEKLAKFLSGKIVAAPSEFMKNFAPKKLGSEPLPFFPIELSEDMAGYNYGPLEEKLKGYFADQIDEEGEDEIVVQLKKAGLDQKLISGMNVFFISSGKDGMLAKNEISKLGLKNSIFVPQELLGEVKDKDFASAKKYLINKIAARFIDQDFSAQDDSDTIIVFTNATDFLRPESWDKLMLIRENKLLTVDANQIWELNNDELLKLIKDKEDSFSDEIRELINKIMQKHSGEDKKLADKSICNEIRQLLVDRNVNIKFESMLELLKYLDIDITITQGILQLIFKRPNIFVEQASQIVHDENIAKEIYDLYGSAFSSDVASGNLTSFFGVNINDYENLFTPYPFHDLKSYHLIASEKDIESVTFLYRYSIEDVLFFLTKDNNLFCRAIPYEGKKYKSGTRGKKYKGNDIASLITGKELKKVSFVKFVNLYLSILLNNFGIRDQIDVDNKSKFIYFGNKKIWPLQAEKPGLKELEELCSSLYLMLAQIQPGFDLFNNINFDVYLRIDEKHCIFLSRSAQTLFMKCSRSEYSKECLEMLDESFNQILAKNPTDEFVKKMHSLTQDLLNGTKRLVFVGMKGLSEEKYLNIRDTIKRDLPHFVATEAILEKNFDGLSLIKMLVPVTGLIASIDEKVISVAPAAKVDDLKNFKQRVATIFENYVNIPDSQIPFVYGEGASKISAKNCMPDAEASECQDLLVGLMQDKDKDLFKRLLDLTVDDLKEKSSQKYQESDLALKQLFVPSIFFNSPVSVLAKLFSSLKPFGPKYALDTVKTLIENSSNEKELLFTANLLLQDINLKVFQEKNAGKQADLVKALKFICKKFIPEKIDKESILDSYERCRKFLTVVDKNGYFSNKPECKVINEYLTSVLDPGQIATTNLVLNNEFFTGMPNPQKIKEFIPKIKEFRAQSVGLGIPDQALFDAKSIQELSLKQLINAHVSGRGVVDMLVNDSLIEAKNAIRAATKNFDLGKITQSVEFGSEREPIHATLIECLQNSVDAIRGFIGEIKKDPSNASFKKRTELLGKDEAINQLGKIEYTLELMKFGAGDSLCLSIVDHIGFPSLKQILSDFMLPDYSTKSPALGNVGDMGNGTFKIYQHATKVFLLTRTTSDPDKVYLLVIKPIRSSTTGLIEDLMFDCFDVSDLIEEFNPKFFGTSFKIIFEEKDLIEARSEYLSTKNFLFECMGCVDVKLDLVQKGTLKLLLNEHGKSRQFNETDSKQIYTHNFAAMNETCRTLFKDKNKHIKITDNSPIFKITQRSNKFMQSYLTTGGIPFKSLGAVLESEKLLPSELTSKLRYGYIVDLALNTYEPVQSRTKLKMDERFKIELRRALFEFYFIRGIMLASDVTTSQEFLNTHFTHFASKISELEQLRLGDTPDKEFQAFYNDFVQGKQIARNASEKDFFDFYRSISLTKPGPKSLHDFIEAECTNSKLFYKKLEEAKAKFEIQANSVFVAILKELQVKYLSDPAKTNVTEAEYKEILDVFQKLYTEDLTKKLEDNEQKIAEFKKYIQDYLKSVVIENNQTYITSFFENVITPWFTEKFKNIKPELKKLSDLENIEPRLKTAKMQADEQDVAKAVVKNITDVYAPGKEFDAVKDFFGTGDVKEFCNKIINEYVKCFFRSLSNQGPGPEEAMFVYEDSPEKGYYSQAKNAIYINLKHYELSELLDFAVTLYRFCNGKEDSLKKVMKTKLYQDLFDEAMKGAATAILTHELEHARRNDATCQGAHTDGYDASGEKVNFNACARSWMSQAIDKGFKDMWYNSIKTNAAHYASGRFKEFLTDDSKLKKWNEFLKQFKKLEKIKPNIAEELRF